MLRSSHSKYCYHHALKLHHTGEVHQILLDLTKPASGGSASATALTHLLSRVCTSVAEGRIPPKQANAIARAAGALLKSISKSMEEPC